MSILINGIEMPKSCHCCRMCVQVADGDIDWHWECCLLADKVERYATDRIPGCPLVPVPPHGRLIEDTAVREQIDEWLDSAGDVVVGHGLSYYGELLGCIEDAPTVIPAEEGE